MKMKYVAISATAILLSATTSMAATVVTALDGSQGWTEDQSASGDAELVDLTGTGGNLENNQPLPTGAVRQTTTLDTADKSKVKIADYTTGLGTVNDIFDNDLGLSYSFYKSSGSADEFAAPALKLEFFGTHPDDGYGELVYEPYWNLGNVAPTPDVWTTETISLTQGLFWTTGMFGAANTAGGPPLRTLQEWLNELDAEFQSASLLSVGIGIGSFNEGQNNYFDNVTIAGVNASVDGTYDFEAPAPIPVPAALPLLLAGLGAFGLVARRRRD